MKILMLLMVLAFVSCSPEGNPASSSSGNPDSGQTPDTPVGQKNPEGRLVFWSMDASDHMEPFVLEEDCGVILLNDGEETKPVPRYILAVHSTGKITDTLDFQTFERELRFVPRGSTIGRYDTCSVPRCYGLTETQIAAFDRLLKDTGLAEEPVSHTVCYCPNKG